MPDREHKADAPKQPPPEAAPKAQDKSTGTTTLEDALERGYLGEQEDDDEDLTLGGVT